MRSGSWAVALAIASLLATATAAKAHEGHHDHGVQAEAPLAEHVRAANGRFARFDAKALEAEGYGQYLGLFQSSARR